MGLQPGATMKRIYDKAQGFVVSGEYALFVHSRNYRRDASVPAVVYCSTFRAGAANISDVGESLLPVLAARGYPILSTDLGDTPTTYTAGDGPGSWSTTAVMTKLAAVLDFAEGSKIGARVGKHAIIGASHGAAAAARFAHDTPTRVACLATVIGCTDLEDIRSNDRPKPDRYVVGDGLNFSIGLQTSIQTALGAGTVPSSANPAQLASTWPTGVPVRVWNSETDPICRTATHQSFVAAVTTAGGTATRTSIGSPNPGHAVGSIDWVGVADWIDGYLRPLVGT